MPKDETQIPIITLQSIPLTSDDLETLIILAAHARIGPSPAIIFVALRRLIRQWNLSPRQVPAFTQRALSDYLGLPTPARVRSAIVRLRRLGLLHTGQLPPKMKSDGMTYRIDEQALAQLIHDEISRRRIAALAPLLPRADSADGH